MFRKDALEAVVIVLDTLKALLEWVPSYGREGSDLRSSVSYIRANAIRLVQDDILGEPMAECFDYALAAGVNLQQVEQILKTPMNATPQLPGAIMIKDSLIQLCLVTESRIIADTQFVSREDVEWCKTITNNNFLAAAEYVADEKDAMNYRAVVSLHAAVLFYLTETARPLPRMLKYQFNLSLPTLALAQRLYHDAGRADEIRKENKIIHPAFSSRIGIALSD